MLGRDADGPAGLLRDRPQLTAIGRVERPALSPDGTRVAFVRPAGGEPADDRRVIDHLLEAGCEVHVHDPVAMDNVKKLYPESVHFHDHHYDALAGVDALCIVTEWSEYRTPDFDYMKQKMKSPVIFDGRNLFHPIRMAEEGFYYSGIGLCPVLPTNPPG